MYVFENAISRYRYGKKEKLQVITNEEERLKHIFSNQVYGLAPTEIIYAIATHYILGFAKLRGLDISSRHFKLLDALPYSQGKMGMTLSEKLDELFEGEHFENT